MTIYNDLKDAAHDYRVAKDSVNLTLLNTVIGELNTKEKNGTEITDSVALKLVNSFISNNNITIGILGATDNDPRIPKLLSENDTLGRFVPVPKEQLSDEQIKEIIGDKNFGNMKDGMGYFKSNYEGQYDPKSLSSILKGVFNK